MSTAAAAEAPAPAKGKKKLIIIVAAVLVLVLGGGGGAMVMMKKKAAAAEEGGEHEAAKKPAPVKAAAPKFDPKNAPTFVPLDPFTVNLADRNADRYAQIGITLELADPKISEQIKVLMPAIRNNVLMVIAERNANELIGREGKDRLAEKVRRETSRALGYDVEDDEEEDSDAADKANKPAKKKKRRVAQELPVRAVHFSNFIIQ